MTLLTATNGEITPVMLSVSNIEISIGLIEGNFSFSESLNFRFIHKKIDFEVVCSVLFSITYLSMQL